jgi:uncharacterized protein
MTKELWLNLPVKDLSKSKAFFTKLGFKFNEKFGGNTDESACLVIGNKNIVVMLFVESTFRNFTSNEIADTKLGTEVLISIDSETREGVEEMARRAEQAGGVVYSKAEEIEGWMYGCGFTDLDGHRWNVLHMDMSKMPAS